MMWHLFNFWVVGAALSEAIKPGQNEWIVEADYAKNRSRSTRIRGE